MNKKVLIKIDCNLEKNIDKKLMYDFFDKMRTYLKVSNSLPEKNLTNEKVKKI